MLAEIYMLRLEAAALAAKEAVTSSSRFVPISYAAFNSNKKSVHKLARS